MLYKKLGFEIKPGTKHVLSVSDVEKFLLSHETSLNDLKKSLKEDGWTGRHNKQPLVFFPQPHITKLAHPLIAPPQPVYAKTISEDLSALKNVPVYDTPVQLTEIDEEPLNSNYRFCFYDVEATHDNAFAGFKLEGYEFTYVPLYEALSIFITIHTNFLASPRPVIFVAFNDTYDGHMIYFAEGKKKDLAHYRNLSNYVIANLGAYTKYKEFERMVGKQKIIPTDMRFNPLQKYIYTFDAQAEIFKIGDFAKGRVINSLKYHALKAGLTWSEDIKSDVFIYNKEDVMHLYELFKIHKGSEIIDILKELSLLSGKPPSIFSSKLILGSFRKQAFPNGMIKNSFLHAKTRASYIKKMFAKHSLSETICPSTKKPLLTYSPYQSIVLVGGHGGIHSFHNPLSLKDGEYQIFDIDFSSFYPHIMTHDDCDFIKDDVKILMKEILKKRISIKKTDPVKSNALKIFLNSLYGKLRDYSPAEPHPGHLVICIAQIILTTLLKELEEERFKLIDVNTDGVLCVIRNSFDVNTFVEKFSDKYKYPLEAIKLKKVYYHNAGNYISLNEKGEFKTKGGWLSTSANNKINGVVYNCVNLTDIITSYLRDKSFIEPRIFTQEFTGEQRKVSIINSLPWYFKPGSFMGSSIFLDKNINFNKKGDSPLLLTEKLIYNKLHTCEKFIFNKDLYE